MTALSDLTDALEGYLVTAGATMNPPVATTVVAGEPTTIGPRPVVAYWFLGIKPWENNTLGVTQEMWGFQIRGYYPLGQTRMPPRSQVEQWIAGFAMAIRTQLYGHVFSGGTATGKGMELGDVVAGRETINGVECRTIEMEWWPQMAAVSTITG